jgi:DeoR family fructose operon transcriptional repressor
MSTNLRHKEILNILANNGFVTIKELTKTLYASEATIRRDLAELEKAGALQRTFGGAKTILDTNMLVPLFIRESQNTSAKSDICRQAAPLIRSGSTVFVDGSSTVQHLAKHIATVKDVIVVTNNIITAEIMCKNHIKTYCAGGIIMENSMTCIGPSALEFAQSINTDICFISCKGISADGKFTDTSGEETAVRKAFMHNAKTRVFLMTENKFGKSYMHTLCHASEVDYLFSNREIPEEIRSQLRK